MIDEFFVAPCAFMIFDEMGYHECKLQPSFSPGPRFCLCAFFYDVSNPLISFEFSRSLQTGECSKVSDLNFPDIYEEKLSRTMRKTDVPSLCPKGYSFEVIADKIFALEKMYHESPETTKAERAWLHGERADEWFE